MRKIICKQCQVEFESKNEMRVFCSRKCYKESLPEKTVQFKCKRCGKDFEVLRAKGKRTYCGTECSRKSPTNLVV